jgi:8-amino-7-oxononanoate synthase
MAAMVVPATAESAMRATVATVAPRPPDRLAFLDQELEELRKQGLLRFNVSIDSPQGATVLRAGRRLVNFSSNDTLSLAAHPAVRQGAADAALDYGGGAGASRLLGGDLLIHRELEAVLAELKGTEGALLFQSGTHANCGTIPALVDKGDAVFSDALNHASIVDGCRLSRAQRFIYRHVDLAQLETLLATPARRKLIVTESLFSMEGDVAPLAELCDLADRHGALLMVDEAHSTGVYGEGAGICRELGVDGRVHVQMGTLGKALGASGAYVAGEARLVNFLVNRARSYIFTTALPPAACGAALAAVALVRSQEGKLRRQAVQRNAALLAAELRGHGLTVGGERHLLGVELGDPERTVRASDALEREGFLVRAIRPPTVPPGTSRLRLAVAADHTEAEIRAAAAAIARAVTSSASAPT